MAAFLPPPPHVIQLTLPPVSDVSFWAQWDFWVALSTLLLAGITLFLALETRKMRQGADSSLRLAIQGVQEQVQMNRRLLRPYVTVFEITNGEMTAQRVPREAVMTVLNTGQTPATHLEILHYVFVCELADPLPHSIEAVADELRTWMATDIGKDQKRTVPGRYFAPDAEEKLAHIRDHTYQFVVCGVVRYLDIFSAEPHSTEFCFVWDPRLEKFNPSGPLNRMT